MSKKINIGWNPGRGEFFGVLAGILLLSLAASFFIISYTPLKNLVPGYPNKQVRLEAARKQEKIDSLERSLLRWSLYSENLHRIVQGGKCIPVDSIIRRADRQWEASRASVAVLEKTDSLLRSDVARKEKFSIGSSSRGDIHIEGLHFFKPLNGTVSRSFDLALHPYIDITAPEGSTVKCALDGNVVFSGWSEADEWVIIVQHEGGVITLYSHLRQSLVKAGDNVNAGTAIAQLGLAAESRTPHLHFEMWHNGRAIDPEEFITL